MPKINSIQNNIVSLEGKYKYKQNQIFTLSNSAKGYLISATEDQASLLVIGDPSTIKHGQIIKSVSDKLDSIEVYENYFGSIISPFGNMLHSEYKTKGKMIGKQELDAFPPKLLDRVKLSNSLNTGILTIDTMIPIGKGQRELIIGDRTTGKTTIALNTIINQKDKNVKSIYVAIGQKRNSIINFYHILEQFQAHKDVIMIFSNPDSPSEQFFAPKIGMAMAEVLAYQGQDVLVVIDDLSKHANVYREIALSIGQNPGREAYPTDIFHQHARLLERSGNFNEKYKNGSITCLPIIETIQGDVGSLIPSNIISITDGQIFTSVDMINNGEFPAIDVGLSVSRTGVAVQSKLLQIASKDLKFQYSDLFDIKKFAEMSIDISEELQDKIKKWHGINNLLIQFGHEGYSEAQIWILTELFRISAISNLKDKNKFSIAFNKYCKNDTAAKMLIARIEKKEYKNKSQKFKQDIKAIFVPLLKIASGIKNDFITSKEYKKLRGDS